MEYNLTTEKDIEEATDKAFALYGNTYSHVYLIKSILYELRYDEGKTKTTDAEIKEKMLELKLNFSNVDYEREMYENLLKKMEQDPENKSINSFCEFLEMCEIDSKIDRIKKYHMKHKNDKC